MEVRTFALLLQNLENGDLLADLTRYNDDLTTELLRQAEALGKAKGEIVLKLKYNADPTTVQIDGEITVKAPKAPRQRSVMWFNRDGSLSGENPRQQKLPLRQVPAPAVVEAGQADAEVRGV